MLRNQKNRMIRGQFQHYSRLRILLLFRDYYIASVRIPGFHKLRNMLRINIQAQIFSQKGKIPKLP